MTRNKTFLWLETRTYKAKMFSKIFLFLFTYNFNVKMFLLQQLEDLAYFPTIVKKVKILFTAGSDLKGS